MNIILLGPPGSGKGTQGSLLARRLHVKQLSTGDLFREILNHPTHPLYPELQVIREGKLVSDDVANKAVADGICKPEFQNGVIFDGYPRTIAQAEALDEILAGMGRPVDLIIELDVVPEVLFFRILGRQICPNCKRVFHESQHLEECPDCHVPLIRREDDNRETIRKRLEEYKGKTAPLQDYYHNHETAYIHFLVQDVSKTPQEINDGIMEQMKQKGIL